MFIFVLAFWLVSLPLLAATQVSTTIYDIDHGLKAGEDILVLLNSGQVAKLPAGKSQLLTDVTSAKSAKGFYKFTLDEDRYIVGIEATEAHAGLDLQKHLKTISKEKSLQTYVPTTITSMDVAKKYFREARYNPKDSQCFNRAMVWSYEWWRNHSLRSQKLLIYFTRTYIRRYNFEWWFHIAPYVHVMENGTVVERAMDVKYSRGPSEFRRWTNLFMRNDAECRVITKFSDYADYPYTGECYIQRTNMYTYQPADLQMNEAWGYTKDRFNMTEVRQAYLEAYDETI
jgi:hypothetical protein